MKNYFSCFCCTVFLLNKAPSNKCDTTYLTSLRGFAYLCHWRRFIHLNSIFPAQFMLLRFHEIKRLQLNVIQLFWHFATKLHISLIEGVSKGWKVYFFPFLFMLLRFYSINRFQLHVIQLFWQFCNIIAFLFYWRRFIWLKGYIFNLSLVIVFPALKTRENESSRTQCDCITQRW